MATGTIKWFNDVKGYGFIIPDGGGEEVFFHFQSILMDGYKTVQEGQRVEYELMRGPKGLSAHNVQSPR